MLEVTTSYLISLTHSINKHLLSFYHVQVTLKCSVRYKENKLVPFYRRGKQPNGRYKIYKYENLSNNKALNNRKQ